MTAQKQSWPSFASTVSVLSIMLYCAGFLRVELELNEQKKRINALENGAETAKPLSMNAKLENAIKINVPGKFVFSLVTYNIYSNEKLYIENCMLLPNKRLFILRIG